MKLSKNKIKQLLKIKNQTQKRKVIKVNKNKGKNLTKRGTKTLRKRKYLNLRVKSLKKFKGGGQKQSNIVQ